MISYALKTYQEEAIAAVSNFFSIAQLAGHEEAWNQCATNPMPYDKQCMGDIPTVCVRIPTGGGKTTLAVYMAAKVGQIYANTDTPLVLWLVPSDAIRQQTIEALQSDVDPCGIAMRQFFGTKYRICRLDDLGNVSPHDTKNQTIVVVATIQSFNVQNTSQRNVYSFDEHMERHFFNLPYGISEKLEKVSEQDLAAQPYLTQSDVGRIKASPANWFAMHSPIVVVDEAHNNRTDQAFRTLTRLNPLCVLEMTATPAKGSNVVFHVSAQALAAESMIKLPVVMSGQPNGWKEAVRDAVLNRQRLEILALKEPDYIRPVLLFQAQPKGGEVTVDVLLDHLTHPDGEKLDRNQIKVATGSQKELDGVNIMDRLSPVRFVITVEALKEGWNCPFAYVLCSLQEMRSAKDIEQLIGRVLRMPYAKRRTSHDDLNKAYAHVVSANVRNEAALLKDRMIANMGFNALEADLALAPSLWSDTGNDLSVPAFKPMPMDAVVALPCQPTIAIPTELLDRIMLYPSGTGSGAVAVIAGEISDDIADFLLNATPVREQGKVQEAIQYERERITTQQSHAARGIPFAPLPQMCICLDGDWVPVDKQVLSELGDFDLLAEGIKLENFRPQETGTVYQVVLEGEHLFTKSGSAVQLPLNDVSTLVSEQDIVRWLDKQCRQQGVIQSTLLKWIGATVRHLIADKGKTLTTLVRCKQQLAVALQSEIVRREKLATSKGVNLSLSRWAAAPSVESQFKYETLFLPNRYPGRPPFYRGSHLFQKHYYGGQMIHDLREKTASGNDAEEFLCAVAIDDHSEVKHWVRNVDSNQQFSFWLPIDGGYFYPDFVCELNDGRLLVIEYKGKQLASNSDSQHKAQVGHQWEITSGGRCLFIMVEIENQGMDVRKQIDRKIYENI